MNEELYQKFLDTPNDEQQYFFNSLNYEERQFLFRRLNSIEKTKLINNMFTERLENLLSLFNGEEKEEIYQYLNARQINDLYKKLPEEEKEEFKNKIDTIFEKLNKDREKEIETLGNLHNNIEKKGHDINLSQQNIYDAKNTIKESNIEIIKISIKIKKVERERKRALNKIERVAKPSPLDNVGLFSKIKISMLRKRIENYKEVEERLINVKKSKQDTIATKEEAKQTIINEKDSIVASRTEIKETSKRITMTTKTIRNTEVRIKNVSKADKKMLGSKLSKKTVSTKEAVCKEPKAKEKEKTTPTAELVGETRKTIENYSKNGVKFVPTDSIKIEQPQQSNLLNEFFATLTEKEKEICAQSITMFGNFISKQQETISKQEEIIVAKQGEQGRPRTLTSQNNIGNSGKINFLMITGLLLVVTIISVVIGIVIIK